MSETEDAAELIEKGAELIRTNGHWQDNYWPAAVLEVGGKRLTTIYTPGQPCCILGSMRAQTECIPMSAARAIMDQIDGQSIPRWNDQPGRTAEEVVEVMLQAAKTLRNGEA